MEKNKKIKLALCGAAIVGVVGIAGVMAYLTDTDEASNKFTIGKVEIEVIEENWPTTDENDNGVPDEMEKILPNQSIDKDPKVHNKGINDAFVFLEVTVPVKNVITAQLDGTPNGQEPTELFTLGTINEGWTQIGTATDVKDADNNVIGKKYIYGYNNTVPAGEETATLFDKVTFANLIEGQVLPTESLDINVKAYAIQSDTAIADKSVADRWALIENQRGL